MAQPGNNEALDMLRQWFERDLSRFARWDRDVDLVALERDGTARISIYTDAHCYRIAASPGIFDRNKPLLAGERYSYLGCIVETRKPRAGEDHTRGNDLHDGPLTEATWVGILGDIVSFEMVQLQRQSSRYVGRRGEVLTHPQGPSIENVMEGQNGTAPADSCSDFVAQGQP